MFTSEIGKIGSLLSACIVFLEFKKTLRSD